MLELGYRLSLQETSFHVCEQKKITARTAWVLLQETSFAGFEVKKLTSFLDCSLFHKNKILKKQFRRKLFGDKPKESASKSDYNN